MDLSDYLGMTSEEFIKECRKEREALLRKIQKDEKAERLKKQRLKRKAEETDSTADDPKTTTTATRRSPRKKRRFDHNFKPDDLVDAINHMEGSEHRYRATIKAINNDGSYTVLCEDNMTFKTKNLTPRKQAVS
jgi:predicted phage gp36 major capsid-like protein